MADSFLLSKRPNAVLDFCSDANQVLYPFVISVKLSTLSRGFHCLSVFFSFYLNILLIYHPLNVTMSPQKRPRLGNRAAQMS